MIDDLFSFTFIKRNTVAAIWSVPEAFNDFIFATELSQRRTLW